MAIPKLHRSTSVSQSALHSAIRSSLRDLGLTLRKITDVVILDGSVVVLSPNAEINLLRDERLNRAIAGT